MKLSIRIRILPDVTVVQKVGVVWLRQVLRRLAEHHRLLEEEKLAAHRLGAAEPPAQHTGPSRRALAPVYRPLGHLGRETRD